MSIAVAVVAVVLAIVLPLTLTGSGSTSGGPHDPRTAATEWGKAALFHDKTKLRTLSCPSSSSSSGLGIYGIVLNGSGVRAGQATPQGSDAWDVPVTSTGPGGGTTIHVKVEKRGGKYLVC